MDEGRHRLLLIEGSFLPQTIDVHTTTDYLVHATDDTGNVTTELWFIPYPPDGTFGNYIGRLILCSSSVRSSGMTKG